MNPNITSLYFSYSEYLAALGQEDRSYAEIQKALKLDPLSQELLFLLGFPLYLKQDFDGARAADLAAIQAHPDFWAPHMACGYSYLAQQRFPEAIAEFEKGRSLAPEATINLSGLAAAYARSGNRTEAMKILALLKKMMSEQYVAPFDIAVVYDSLGDTGRALDWLEKAANEQSEMMLFLKIYPPIADLRGIPRFEDLVRRIGVSPN